MTTNTLQMMIQEVNASRTMRRHLNSVSLAFDIVKKAMRHNEANGNNSFIASVTSQAMRGFCSEKQAYCLAKWMLENNIEI